MRRTHNLLGFLFIYLLSACGYVQAQDQKIDFTSQWDTARVLKNPYKGWYHHLLDNGVSKYAIKNDSVFASFPGMDHLYLRLAWSYLEPKEGAFDWSYIDKVVEKYVPKGYKIAFRISCSETGTYPNSVGEQVDGVQYATPSWVEKAGAKGTIVDKVVIKFWVPKWDDPVYLEKLNQFHQVFAARYDGKPWVSYVDVGSIGDWGEGHTSSSTRVPPTVSEV
ncbi:MAG: beta-galactosidase, partial [Bacteroidales bacterium]